MMVLAPPPVAARTKGVAVVPLGSFQAPSGMGPSAESRPTPLLLLHQVLGEAVSLNCVPPTQVTFAVAQMSLMEAMSGGWGARPWGWQESTPESPEETKTEIPWAAAWA